MASPSLAREAGIGQRRGCQTTPKYTWSANSPLRGRIFLWKKLLRPTRSRPILPQAYETGLCGWSALSARVVAFRVFHPAKPLSRR
jgi:hypothetical protein